MFDFFKKKSKGAIDAESISNPEELDRYIKNNPYEVCNLFKNENFIKRVILNQKNARASGLILEQNALDGNVDCQEMVSGFAKLAAKNTSDPKTLKPLLEKTIKFGRMAAKNGNITEIKDLPISLGKLGGLLFTENGNVWHDDLKSYFNEAYEWYLKNAENQDLSAKERKEAKAKAIETLETKAILMRHTN